VAAAALLLAALPWLVSTYLVTFLYLALVSVALAQSYDWVGGHLGYMNLGQAAFFGVGAYAGGLLLVKAMPPAVAFAAAALVPAGFAAAIAIPFFRLRGAYFALATFGLVALMELLAHNLAPVTGGALGLSLPPGNRLVPAYYLTLVLVALMVGGTAWVSRSRHGLALRSIQDDEEAAGALGVRAVRVKCVVLIASAGVAGLAGGIYGWYITFLSPSAVFGLDRALGPVVMAMLGGSGTIAGPLVGAAFVNVVEEILRVKVGAYVLTTYGAILVLVGLFLPGGLVRTPAGRWLEPGRQPVTGKGTHRPPDVPQAGARPR
jgi:branched-chain amino acid transport system permease protein